MATIQSTIELYDSFSPVLYNVMDAVNLTIASVEHMQQSLGANMDITSLDGAVESIHQAEAAMAAMNEQMVNHSNPNINIATPEPVQIPVHWQVDNMEIFTNTGVERFQREVQSANTMLQQLTSTQDEIARQAYNTNIFPPEAFQDLNSLAVRIDTVRNRIQQIENNPVNLGTDTANASLEQLRSQLNAAVQQQNNLNAAMHNMDVSAANAAYVQLENTISNTERYIRDNADEQGRFNQQIRDGTTSANGLLGSIQRMAAAYLSIRTVGAVLNISDELTQTTARLNLMNSAFAESGMEQQEMMNTIYAAAQNARASYADMASVVARFGNNAKDAFGSSAEVVDFANLVQKQMKIAGATAQESSAAMLQLSQALGSGVLRGDELNSIFEQAPNLIQNIADYMDVPIGQIREMAKEGELTADIVKSAVFAATDEINARFEEIPMTWGDLWTSFQNTALMAFQPVLERLNDMANNQQFQAFVNGAIETMAVLANVVLNAFELVGSIASVIIDNWSWISPIIYGVIAALVIYNATMGLAWLTTLKDIAVKGWHVAANAAQAVATFATTVAQQGLNAALAACPITWIIIAIIALIAIFYAAVAAINEFAGTSYSATGIICGIFAVAGAFIGNLFITLINAIIDVFVVLWNFIAAWANFFGNVFNDPVGAIARLFFDLVDCILALLETLASAIDTIFGSNLASAVSGWRDSLGGWVDSTFGQGEEIMAKVNAEDYHLERFEYSGAWDAGYSFGHGIKNTISNLNLSDIFGATNIPNNDYANAGAYGDSMANIANNTGSTADNTADIADALEITEEDLKYLRDIAEREVIDRTVLKSVTIDMSGMTNKVENMQDLDGISTYLAKSLRQQMEVSMEGA